ncbi:MAG TPA: adenylosuccinate synthase [Gemmatimonadota bacterium]|nr:adenylosuccinate synthase [Gemmatimonadota bacterium]
MNRIRGTCQVVVGAQWGDEGKGKIVDVLAERADVVARYQGGANAGHTVVVGGEEFILHQVPSGVLHPDKECLLGNGVVLDAAEFFREIDLLEERGIDAQPRVWVSSRAHLLLPWHKALDAAKEGSRGTKAIGTTGRGIGPAYEDKVGRMGIRVADCADADRLRALIEEGAEAKRAALSVLGLDAGIGVDDTLAEIEGWRERLLARATDVSQRVAAHLAAGRRILLEGAQGSQLDIDHGTYPYVTSSSTTAGGAVIGIGLGPKYIDDVIGVVKAYTTRVGNGPLPTEVESPLQERLREAGDEYGATTGRPRRCGWFDAVVVRYAARINSLTELAVTKLDVLDGFETVRLCTGYRSAGGNGAGELDEFPANLALLERCVPTYEDHAGWEPSISGARSWDDLPVEARRYLERIEELVGVPIRRVSVGQDRDQILERS